MNENLYIYGYLVKSLTSNPRQMFPPLNPDYKGIGRHISWPLDGYDDKTTKVLEQEAWEKWFGYHDVFWLEISVTMIVSVHLP